jgi:hypothetical protein
MHYDADDMADIARDVAYDDAHEADRIKVEAYDETTGDYKDVILDLTWSVYPTEYDGQYVSSQGSANVDTIKLAQPVQVNGKVYNELDEELTANILTTSADGYTSLHDYIDDQHSGKVQVPQHKYPDSTR